MFDRNIYSEPNAEAARIACWDCGVPTEGEPFCPSCTRIQPVSGEDYYDALGLTERLVLDHADLEQRFYARSRQFHPDRFMTKSPREREIATLRSEVVNRAYQILRDPLARGQYMLERRGISRTESKQIPAELAEEYFELQEALMDIRMANEDERRVLLEKIDAIRDKIEGVASDTKAALFAAYDDFDARLDKPEGQGDILDRIARLLNDYNYLRSMLRDIEAKLAATGVEG